MANSVFEDVNSSVLASYWQVKEKENAPYLWDTLFPTIKQQSSEFSFLRGTSNAPKMLSASAFDAPAIMEDRQGYEKISDRTRYFKAGKYIDEAMRQQLLRVEQYGTQIEKDTINQRIFDDETELLKSASLTREFMRNRLVQTGKLDFTSNGQHIQADYEMKDTHIATVDKAWGIDGSTPFDDIKKAQDVVANDSGQVITRAVMTTSTFNSMLKDPSVKATMLVNLGNLGQVAIPQSELLSFLAANYNLNIQLYDKTFNNGETMQKFIPDGHVIFLPEGNLGNTYMSTTPEEADLMSASDVDVSIVDQGVAITTILTSDPVNKKTNVSQQVMPSFEQIDAVYNLDVAPTGSVTPPEGNGDGTEAPEA